MSEPHFSQAADNNKEVILDELRNTLKPGDHVLEIASGTGQHAIHFSEHLPEIVWQPSDRDLHEYGLAKRLGALSRSNLLDPVELDVNQWPEFPQEFDAIYSANCIHIINWQGVQNYIAGAGPRLQTGGTLLFYGPFKYGGNFTTESNAKFDAFLRQTYPGGGIRDFEAVDDLAAKAGFSFESDTAMPANNQFLVWRKSAAKNK